MPTPLPTLQEFVTEDFFSLIGMKSMSDTEKESILDKMSQTVHARVYLQISQELTEEERKEMDAGASTNIIPYLTEKGFDLVTMLYEESMRYRYELATAFKMATNS